MTDQSDARLARHFRVFIEDQILQRKYENATEVIEDALRLLEAREAKHEALRRALIAGEESGDAGPLDFEEIKRKAREEAAESRNA